MQLRYADHVVVRTKRMTDEIATGRRSEALVSVDVETSGATPGTGSLLSIGACLVDRPEVGVYLELTPLPGLPWSESAERIHALDRERLEREGMSPPDAMQALERWLSDAVAGSTPVFVGFNAPFDWMFVADYFHRFLGHNPFGVSALDLKSYYMALEGIQRWGETRRADIDVRLGLAPDHNHHALDDARGQAAVARRLLRRHGDSSSGD